MTDMAACEPPPVGFPAVSSVAGVVAAPEMSVAGVVDWTIAGVVFMGHWGRQDQKGRSILPSLDRPGAPTIRWGFGRPVGLQVGAGVRPDQT